MDLRQLKIFTKLAEKGSFSKVAEELYLSQPTISFQIRQLEKDIGTRLFERSTKRLKLTQEGRLFYNYACRILELNKRAREEIDEFRGFRRGELTIGASNIPGIYILPDWLGRFKQRYPDIKIDLKIMDTQQILTEVLEAKVDLGVVGSIVRNSQLRFERLIQDELVLIASAHHPWAKRRFIDIKELKNESFILREEGSGTREVLKENLLRKKVRLQDLNVVMQLGNNEAVKKAVMTGLGVSFVSNCSVANEVRLNLLKRIPAKDFSIRRFFYIVYSRGGLSFCAKAFHLFLLDNLKL